MKQISTLVIAIIAFAFYSNCYSQVSISIDSSVHYQTITGWGHGGSVFGGLGGPHYSLDSSVSRPVCYKYLDYLIDELGLTGSRIWEVGPRVDGTGNDNGDCDSLDWSKFQSNTFDPAMGTYIQYFRDRVNAKGFQTNFYSSPTYPSLATIIKPWVLNHPGERAQQIWSSAYYYKNTYSIDINYAVIYNEPASPVTSAIIVDDIKALGPRLAAQGLGTKAQYAEGVAPQTSWNFITPTQNDSVFWSHVGRISYHNYGTADPYRANMRDYAGTLGITTAQTEMANPTFDDLYKDLTLGGVSYWEVGYSSSNSLANTAGLTCFTPSSTFFRLRQVMHYVRPGALRINATSNDSTVQTLAFKRNGKTTIIMENIASTAKTVNLSAIPAGKYGLSYAASGATAFQEMGIKTVNADGLLSLTINGNSSVYTLYPYAMSNQPPTIMTFSSNPGYIVDPTTSITLSSTATDPELDPITYHWTILSQPAGANALLNNPNSANTTVSGLTQSGTYVFNIEARDTANNSVNRTVHLIRYSANPPAMISQLGFRFGAPYGLVFSKYPDTTHAIVELPTSSTTLQIGIGDIANSDFTGHGTWSLVSAPNGANVNVSATTYIYVSIRANVTGMTVPGDYFFKCVITNAPYSDLTCYLKCTIKPTSSAPVISGITANPPVVNYPGTCELTGNTSDPEGDLMRYWWVVKTAPAGAYPTFDHQGRAKTNVGNLNVAGNYTFTLRTFDDLHMTTRDVTISVNRSATKPTITPIGNITIYQDSTATAGFTIGGNDTTALTLQAISANPALLPIDSIRFSGTGTKRSVMLSPASGNYGTSDIMIIVKEGTDTASASFRLKAKRKPDISAIADISFPQDSSYSQNFVVHADSVAGLKFYVNSSNEAILPADSLKISGADTLKTLSITAKKTVYGSANLKILISDGTKWDSCTFTVTIRKKPIKPSIASIADIVINENSSGSVDLIVHGENTDSLKITFDCNNLSLIPKNNITISGKDTLRKMTITPAKDQLGTARIIVYVADSTGQSSTSFKVTVNKIVLKPAVSQIKDIFIVMNQKGSSDFKVWGEQPNLLSLWAISDNELLLPKEGITFSGKDSLRTIQVSPSAQQTGKALVTVLVSDGTDTARTNFSVVVSKQSVKPQISKIDDISIAQDSTFSIDFIIDGNIPESLVTWAQSSNDTLIPLSNISFSGQGKSRSAKISPAKGKYGTAEISIFISDGKDSASTSFTVTITKKVNSANDMEDGRIVIYPNPASDKLNVIAHEMPGEWISLVLYDAEGIARKSIIPEGKNSITLRLNDLPEGSYLLRFTFSTGIFYKKFVLIR